MKPRRPDPQASVAIILALTVFFALVGSGEVVHFFVGMDPEDSYTMSDKIMSVWENMMFAIIGALSGYIGAGGGKKDD